MPAFFAAASGWRPVHLAEAERDVIADVGLARGNRCEALLSCPFKCISSHRPLYFLQQLHGILALEDDPEHVHW
jgi:hypothetical protein